ncbi:polysaccharide deacetylase family protein [uncultured Chitinophaga sp.]|uniref:polysaccharide deacetylase family protein n=1 Tax=uncultured Chitinophaga sp. TaxID=339340 RepID=UPI0025EA900C|nr:polysaccharide deacetylase family protein [uncultured Chitinophaga sp.]
MNAILLLLLSCITSLPAGNTINKPVICLTYDDGLDSHLQTVLPQLNTAGFKATFFLNAIRGAATVIGAPSPAVKGWRMAALQGHELGNHTLFHPCPQALGWPGELSIESYTVDRLMAEITAQQSLLAALDTTRKQRSFAYPCNNTVVAGVDYAAMLREKGLALYARAGGDSSSIIADFKKLDAGKVPSWLVPEGTSGEALIAFAQKVKQQGGMGIYQFHGVGGEFFRVTPAAHQQLVRYLQEHREEYEVLTFSAAMELVTRR